VIQAIQPPSACPLCGGAAFEKTFTYTAQPSGEIRFAFSSTGSYLRQVFTCRGCGHMLSLHDMDEKELYAGDYVESTYGRDGLKRSFDRINALDPANSDNVGRVMRVNEFARALLPQSAYRDRQPTVLDIGSGLCVFLYRMKAVGWDGTALDPDERAVQHAREVVGVKAVCADFLEADDLGKFDLITFNKVLEHVKDPVFMLARSCDFLAPGGLIYVELPDGEAALHEGFEREEFFIEHHHVFSAASIALLARRAGFRICLIERLREPSTKFTLRAFLQ